MPLNIKMCFTALQTDDAPAMVKLIYSLNKDFLKSVDFFVHGTTLSNTALPGGVAYSGRGVCNFVLEISDGNPAQEICSNLTGSAMRTKFLQHFKFERHRPTKIELWPEFKKKEKF